MKAMKAYYEGNEGYNEGNEGIYIYDTHDNKDIHTLNETTTLQRYDKHGLSVYIKDYQDKHDDSPVISSQFTIPPIRSSLQD